jgi:hypothetical protein
VTAGARGGASVGGAGEAAPGDILWADVDWATGERGPLAALRWRDGVLFAGSRSVPVSGDPERVAALALLRTAQDAVAAIASVPRNRVDVVGRGIVAAFARRMLGVPSPRGDVPLAVVVTTADETALIAATRRLADSGTLVLASETGGRALPLDLYPDVHVRGLRIVAVPPLLSSGIAEAPAWLDDHLAQHRPRPFAPGESTSDVQWLRLGG